MVYLPTHSFIFVYVYIHIDLSLNSFLLTYSFSHPIVNTFINAVDVLKNFIYLLIYLYICLFNLFALHSW